MKSPEACETLAEVRAEIDRLDAQIISLIGERAVYVHAAAGFKTDEASVRAPERQQQMMAQRRQWAEAAGLEPDVIEQMYRLLIDYFIRREMELVNKRENPS